MEKLIRKYCWAFCRSVGVWECFLNEFHVYNNLIMFLLHFFCSFEVFRPLLLLLFCFKWCRKITWKACEKFIHKNSRQVFEVFHLTRVVFVCKIKMALPNNIMNINCMLRFHPSSLSTSHTLPPFSISHSILFMMNNDLQLTCSHQSMKINMPKGILIELKGIIAVETP